MVFKRLAKAMWKSGKCKNYVRKMNKLDKKARQLGNKIDNKSTKWGDKEKAQLQLDKLAVEMEFLKSEYQEKCI